MKGKKKITDINEIGTVGKIILFVFVLLIMSAFWLMVIVFAIVGIQMLLTSVDKTIIAVLIPAVFGIITYWLTKANERKAYLIKQAREYKFNVYNEYIDFLIAAASTQNFNLEALLTCNIKIILFATPQTVQQINKLVVTYNKNDSKEILSCIEAVIRSIRSDLGYEDRLVKKGELLAAFIGEEKDDNQ